ncbi:target of Nesh-SH3 isoform X44 [Tympanuchus pallidicinctus]|uniref:target of Nesh-SH3 isoform X43 n=1 Tax=Tympanuchus pallidicinctus TaxID=109042 RepID=UPI002286CE20|nr:target of Nesh-SH3 isoform X43 [Tympanuchus pallidicinctus]XP_052520589.1 target of Nesh-SH3 isoform X44 [Tympanuchus pallidicinctus]
MMPRLVLLLFCGYIAVNLGSAQKLPRVKRQSLKVQINATDDTVCMRYLRPSQNTKLEGFVLGYGSSFFSNQYIPLPSDGSTYINELDAEPRYLVSVRPARVSNNKKSCSGRNKNQKPLQLVVGTLTPTSVFLSWGILVNPQHDWTATSNCASDRFYTVRYREKDKDKKWVFQLCPVTETVVDNLKPNTLYEFGVKDNMEDSIWSKTFNHKTVLSSKKVNGQLQNMYKLVPSTQSQLTLRDNKKLVPVTIIKQVIQNRTQSKTSDSSSLPGAILVHLIVPGLNETQQKLLPPLSIDDISQVSRKKLGKNETQVWPAESKTPEVQEISPQSLPAQAEKKHGPKEFKSTPKPELQTQNILVSNEIHPLPSGTRIFDAPKSPLTELATQSPTLKSVSLPSADTREMEIAVDETQPVSSRSKTSGTTEVQPTKSASHGFLHITSTPQTFTASEMTDAAGFTADLEITMPVITTEPQLLETALATQRPKLKPTSPYVAIEGRVGATQRRGPDFTSTASPKATRTMKATRRPRLKSTTPSSLTTQQTVIAPKEFPRIPSKPKPSPKPHIPQAKDVLESVTFRTDQPKPTIVPKESHRIPSRPRIPPSSEVPQTKPALEPITFRTEKPKSTSVPRETRYGPSKPKTSPSPRVPPTRASPKESRRVTAKPRTSPIPDLPHTKPAPKETQQTSFKPKPAPIPDASQRKPGIIPSFREPDSTMIPQMPQRIKPTLAATEKPFIHTKPKTYEKPRVPYTRPAVHQTTPQTIITKTSTTTEQSRATMAPKETMLLPFKPKSSVETEVPQTKPAPKTTHLGSINLITVHVVDGSKMTLVPNETYQISPKPKTALTTEIPWLYTAGHKTRLTSLRPRPSDKSQARPAPSKTTVAPARTKAPGLPKWIVPTTDDIYTPEDIARHIGMDVKKPLEYIDTWEKPFSGTTSPRPQHPPIPPVKPTPMRRKPLPPNTVTGKPGIPAKPAGPTMPVKTGVPYKTPTAFATPEYYVDATVFSSSPTSETDSSGKPRYLAPHVKYMKKDDDVPCSITSSLEHFPQEEAGIKEEPTRPPQNPPTNLTVVTVEGCPTFVILDWEKPDNDTVTEYEVVSTENGATDGEKEKSIITTNQTHSTVENLKPDTSYEFHVKPRNPLGEGPSSNVVAFSTESADPRVSEPISMGKDAIWTEIPFNSDSYSECRGKQYVKRTWYKKFVGVQLCNSLRYKIYLSDSLTGKFYNIGDQRGHGEDHCQFVDSFLDGRTGQQDDLPVKDGFFRAVRQEPVKFGKIGGETHINYVRWYECGTSIPGKW